MKKYLLQRLQGISTASMKKHINEIRSVRILLNWNRFFLMYIIKCRKKEHYIDDASNA